jgi:hypothetical protein
MRYLGYNNQGSALNAIVSKGSNALVATVGYGIVINATTNLSYKAASSNNATGSNVSLRDIVFSGIRDDATSNSYMYINGSLDTASTGPIISVNTNLLYIGRDGSTGRYTDSNVGELIIAGGEMSTANRQKIEGYLAWKWGLMGNLPANHPYKNRRPTQ